LAERIKLVKDMMIPNMCLSRLLKFARIPKSSWYYAQKSKMPDQRAHNNGRPVPGFTLNRNGENISDTHIVEILNQYRNDVHFQNGGGYTKLTHYLRREHGLYINRKKIYRLCKENQLLLPKRKKAKTSWKSISQNRIITAPNQLWEFDIKYGFVHGENRFFFVLAFIDVLSRKVMGKYVGSHCNAGDLRFTLNEAMKRANIKDGQMLITRSDNGSQMTSNVFYKYLKELEKKLCHEFIPPATPNKNAHVESFFSILEIEFMQTRYFRTMAEAYTQTHAFIDFYNQRRIHKALKYRTPNEIIVDYELGKVLHIKPVSL
jgi:putative transposase